MPGVFDRDTNKDSPSERTTRMKPEQGKETSSTKLDFKSPQEQAAENAGRIASRRNKPNKEDELQSKIDNLNQMIGDSQEQKKIEEEFQEMESISAEDLKLAEQLLFQGYAEKVYTPPNFDNIQITICSNTPDEINLIEEMLFDMVKASENTEGDPTISDSEINSRRSLYSLALSLVGINGKDICPNRIGHLAVIKKAILRLPELELEGNIENLKSLRDEIKKSIKMRTLEIRKKPTPVIDMISKYRYEFNTTMFSIMNKKGILPKS